MAEEAQVLALLCNFCRSWGKSIRLSGLSFVSCERVTNLPSQVLWGNETG